MNVSAAGKSGCRLVFFGSSEFAIPTLRALIDSGYAIGRVYTQAPAPAGRGKRLHRTPVHRVAIEQGLDVATPDHLDAETVDDVMRLHPDVAVLVSYGQLIPAAMLDVPAHGFLNIHPSLLPRWRGAAPVQRAIMAGDARTGVTIMHMDAHYDSGMILMQEEATIHPDDTAASLAERLAARGASLLARTLETLETIAPRPQTPDGITRAPKISREETRVDWHQPAVRVDAMIRGLSPKPGAWTRWNDNRVKILMSCLAEDEGPPGAVLDDCLTVACGTGAIRIKRLQAPSGKTMDGPSFLRGYGKGRTDCFT
ncbi:MAG: methionyl-tRNA formyltransferase [Rhodobacteraceae bacterium]|nr:methionyl-tRNA formyltransferase [Paracoccaceae bacterium]